jgi:putative DNA primase/helicase
MDIDAIKAAARGKWRGIYEHFGIDVGNGKHGPCPACSNSNPKSDRFRYDDKHGNGDYYCNGCGAGDGISLVQKVTGMQFIEVMKTIAEIIGEVDPDPKKTRSEKDPRIALNKVWTSSNPIQPKDPVLSYLRSRKINLEPKNVRYCPSCFEPDTKENLPAMVARIQSKDGKPVSIHRTYLADIDKKKKLMPGTEPLSGSAIRLFEPGGIFEKDILGIAEGIETAMSATQLFRIATWATISTSIMVGFKPPKGYRKFTIFADNDANHAGQKAAHILANKLYLDGYLVKVETPEIVGDWNDVLIEHAQELERKAVA